MKIKTPNPSSLSPMMAQWYACKQEAKNALLLFRLGDFYEAFYEDAKILSKAVNVTLTQRQSIPMSGIPAHASEGYIKKLVEQGFLVAIAEQMEDPKQVKGLVKRKVVKTISPGTLLSASLLPEESNNFFACLSQVNTLFGMALLDLSTGELTTLELQSKRAVYDELLKKPPSEILISEKNLKSLGETLKDLKKERSFRLNVKEDWVFNPQSCYEFLTRHLKVHSLDGFGFKEKIAAINAVGALLSYVQGELSFSIEHIKTIQLDEPTHYMAIDAATQRNLELTEKIIPSGDNFTLLTLLDKTCTPMGSRLFKTWLTHPLLSVEMIRDRQDATEELTSQLSMQRVFENHLKTIRDLERLIIRIATGYSTPRDLAGLKASLKIIPKLLEDAKPLKAPLFKKILTAIPDTRAVYETIDKALVDDPPLKIGEGNLIRKGFSSELDELMLLKTESQSWIASYQAALKKETGIKTLKIIYSKAFGFCIEVSRGQAKSMPSTFERRQTLVNAERFTSLKLKNYEEKILNAEEKIGQLEKELYVHLRKEISTAIDPIKQTAQAIAHLDSLFSLAKCAHQFNYHRPTVDASNQIDIKVGRHPIIENSLLDQTFIPNDTFLDEKSARLLLITGPNMAGKSTYIRQVALITIMAQIGSFVPAESAHIGIVDKVFSRIGASDDLSRGQSTFMIEMLETANILNNATPRSLIILDEIGRGTSTYDGISIAWSVAEHLLTLDQKGVKTLFATHYFELTELEKTFPAAKNLKVAIHESEDNIVFLRKIVSGSTDKSYGIHVAKLAGVPQVVIQRAEAMLKHLENKMSPPINETLSKVPPKKNQEQLTFFAKPSKEEFFKKTVEKLKKVDLNTTTPMQALKILEQIQSSIKKDLKTSISKLMIE